MRRFGVAFTLCNVSPEAITPPLNRTSPVITGPMPQREISAKHSRPAVSIAVMCYNEAELLRDMVNRVLAVLQGPNQPFEILIVDDGSTDGSGPIADQIAAEHAEVRVLHHSPNLGIGHVLINGYRQTTGEVVAILPADLQFAPEDLPRALEALKDADVVNIRRPDRRDPPMRKLISRFDETLVWLLFGVWIRDLHWVKLYRRDILDRLTIVSQTPMVDTELLIRSHKLGAKIVELSLPHHPRTAGRSTGATLARLIHTFADLWKLRWRLWFEK